MNDERTKKIEATVRPQLRFLHLLAILFIALKLTDQVNWSWLWVLSPLWIPWVVIALFLIVAGILFMVVWLYDRRLRKLRRKRQLILRDVATAGRDQARARMSSRVEDRDRAAGYKEE